MVGLDVGLGAGFGAAVGFGAVGFGAVGCGGGAALVAGGRAVAAEALELAVSLGADSDAAGASAELLADALTVASGAADVVAVALAVVGAGTGEPSIEATPELGTSAGVASK
jgi:hypothetical protein